MQAEEGVRPLRDSTGLWSVDLHSFFADPDPADSQNADPDPDP